MDAVDLLELMLNGCSRRWNESGETFESSLTMGTKTIGSVSDRDLITTAEILLRRRNITQTLCVRGLIGMSLHLRTASDMSMRISP